MSKQAPSGIYGLPNISVDPREVLNQCKAKVEARMKRSGWFTEEERAAARKKLDNIGNQTYPTTVQVLKNKNTLHYRSLDDLEA